MSICMLLLFLISLGSCSCKEHDIDHARSKASYIVYLGGTRGIAAETLTTTHQNILARAIGSEEGAAGAMIYSYKHALSGFAAYLTDEQANVLSEMPEVLSIFPSRTLELQTTRSWDFLGLPRTPQAALPGNAIPTGSSDVIIGILDTGIWPESKSFDDTGMAPVPARWNGACENAPGTNASVVVHCNKKIIGAKYYRAGLSPNASIAYSNPRDFAGHGTGVSAIAAGMPVKNVSMEAGLAQGDARGGFPAARIAMYKVCWGFQCYDIDIVAALDDAINDGVDIISLSLGDDPVVYSVDSIAIGAYHAIERGIVVSCACGNSGRVPGSVTNVAPWIFTVGASSIDRKVTPNGSFPFSPAPIAASFSSRGPNIISPDIIKPDVIAPGLDILSAWSPVAGVRSRRHPGTGFNWTFIRTDYAIASGTSFACPHVTGTIAYVKSIHPTWSPAAIKSAIMTTATTVDNQNHPITEEDGSPANVFSIGSGQIQPAKALDPGLVYDTTPNDYILYLCSGGYTQEQIRNITGDNSTTCPRDNALSSLNYPSICFNALNGSQTLQRTVTNVGAANAVYQARIEAATDKRLSIAVSPAKLTFTGSGQKLSFNVTVLFSAGTAAQESSAAALLWVFSALAWEDGTHVVKSPIAVSVNA
ncbi:subtilisin-like protease SBT3.9 [Selaginella moellendorffii]|uniref:subtilisin-like protease SBT3.9 n=1 Tax=Selaginella moellendorffii TaxID=88036 RepID=UPI000D1CC967|nr:subtilisin-like protease SBT3.9 [Selaginella moellendorffii]XP_024544836.1 subtilisin-like protease SBT3.9 [Selaginella moellendorffii]XP_024544837.1 subtilisin-like protease SBT3.9 [Selaginella moellendorffii]|eukprot:XP_024544835.1 subtilisin-like protease SBT3.9 [Selaginella moellendorffii]